MVTHQRTVMVTNRDRYRQAQGDGDINRPIGPRDRDTLLTDTVTDTHGNRHQAARKVRPVRQGETVTKHKQ